LFLDTGKHFKETLEYVDLLEKEFGLTDLRRLQPDPKLLQNSDPDGELWKTNVNRCCWLRKVEPLNRTLGSGEFEAVITGRKYYQTNHRADIDNIELFDDGIFRINPLFNWTKEKIKDEFEARGLPQHPLVAKGYPSIGCEPCTKEVKPGEDERSGRWAHTIDMTGAQKEECGIHVSQGGDGSDWML
jgi:phosphoadenosine phosphosulfate reductase